MTLPAGWTACWQLSPAFRTPSAPSWSSTLLAPLVDDFTRLEDELDRFKPSVVFAPIADLAAPLLALLENVQKEAIDALFALFQAPLALLDRLRPAELTQHIQAAIDEVLAALRTVNFPARYAQIKAHYFDLKGGVTAGGIEAKIELVGFLEPDALLDDLARGYNAIVGALEGLKTNVELGDDLADAYTHLRDYLLAMLPPFARELMDPEKFKRVMRLADPTRFLADLDVCFETIKNKLLPIRPQDLAGELDATYETVLAMVDGLSLAESLNQVKASLAQAQEIVNSLRVDFLAGDLADLVTQLRTLAAALDPTLPLWRAGRAPPGGRSGRGSHPAVRPPGRPGGDSAVCPGAGRQPQPAGDTGRAAGPGLGGRTRHSGRDRLHGDPVTPCRQAGRAGGRVRGEPGQGRKRL